MHDGLIKIRPDKYRAKSVLKMSETTLEMIRSIDSKKFPSIIIKEYYEVIRSLITAILIADGFKTEGEGAHKKLIEYLNSNYKEFSQYEISTIDNLRIMRNKIAYEGFFVNESYLKRKKELISTIIEKLEKILKEKLI
ncbi:MAG: hypothetical protein HYW23_03890 [Candidatus Aenigmarchaeota archaeon]|nr:hypothetical protein [Candidatus Aenigmarchaeota archaeon]